MATPPRSLSFFLTRSLTFESCSFNTADLSKLHSTFLKGRSILLASCLGFHEQSMTFKNHLMAQEQGNTCVWAPSIYELASYFKTRTSKAPKYSERLPCSTELFVCSFPLQGQCLSSRTTRLFSLHCPFFINVFFSSAAFSPFISPPSARPPSKKLQSVRFSPILLHISIRNYEFFWRREATKSVHRADEEHLLYFPFLFWAECLVVVIVRFRDSWTFFQNQNEAGRMSQNIVLQ